MCCRNETCRAAGACVYNSRASADLAMQGPRHGCRQGDCRMRGARGHSFGPHAACAVSCARPENSFVFARSTMGGLRSPSPAGPAAGQPPRRAPPPPPPPARRRPPPTGCSSKPPTTTPTSATPRPFGCASARAPTMPRLCPMCQEAARRTVVLPAHLPLAQRHVGPCLPSQRRQPAAPAPSPACVGWS